MEQFLHYFSEKEILKQVDKYRIKRFLHIFPLKISSYIFLAVYTFFFLLMLRYPLVALFTTSEFDFATWKKNHYGSKLLAYMLGFTFCITGFVNQLSLRGAATYLYLYTIGLRFLVLLEMIYSWRLHGLYMHEYYLNSMYTFLATIEVTEGPILYFYMVIYTITLFIGGEIGLTMYSYHRECWIPINENIECDIPDIDYIPTPNVSNQLLKRINNQFMKKRRR